MNPRMGQIVAFVLPSGGQAPAIIQCVNEDGSVNLWVFGSRETYHISRSTTGFEPNQWLWLA